MPRVSKPSAYHRHIQFIALLFEARRDEASRDHGVWHQSLQTEGIARGGGGWLCSTLRAPIRSNNAKVGLIDCYISIVEDTAR
jgi:hypothetical protein